jgi:ornithine carbamoyltransferase
MVKRNFLRLGDFSLDDYRGMFQRAHQLKRRRKEHLLDKSLEGRTLVLLFEKPSTRTRLSFEAAICQLGGNASTLNAADSQLGRGETIDDTARVVSRYADAVMLRTFGHDRLQQFAAAATVPVINGLSDGAHPVQLMADLFTLEERFGSIEKSTVAFIGDGASNMARSWAEAAQLFGFALRIAAPPSYRPPPEEVRGPQIQLTSDPFEAVAGANAIATDTWTSMGQEAEAQKRRSELRGFCVDEKLLAKATRECIVLHCLPAHRGEEISGAVIDGPQSAVFDEAENRLHVQKALLERLILAP